jgi:hypothetical protein
MRILIEDPGSETYFDGSDWTGDNTHAKDFGTVAKAEAFCNSQRLDGAVIVVKFKNSENDIRYSPNSRNALLVSKPPTTKIRSLRLS